MNTNTVNKILSDWENGFTHEEIISKYKIDRAVEFGITECSGGLSANEIAARITRVKPGMKGAEILNIMQGNK